MANKNNTGLAVKNGRNYKKNQKTDILPVFQSFSLSRFIAGTYLSLAQNEAIMEMVFPVVKKSTYSAF